MEGSDGSPPQSLCMIRAAELFPKSQMEKEDTQLVVPFQELAGESVRYLGRTDDGVLALSNYRIFLLKISTNSETSVPLGLIEAAQTRDLFHLIINCKDASTVKCSFETAEQCSEWQRRIQLSVGVPESLESLFAFPFCSWTCDNMANNSAAGVGGTEANGSGGVHQNFVNGDHILSLSAVDYTERLQRASRFEDDFMREVDRLGFDLHGSWRISNVNEEFKLCPSYPQKILVPCCISDETLQIVANFRGSRRLPAVVWRHKRTGAVIARCSQPEVGWLGWRNAKDEQLLKALADACAFDRGEQKRRLSQAASKFGMPLPSESESSPSSPDCSHEEVALDEVRKVLIVDARSYTSAVTNRARGGGCECIEYYPCAEIEFMNLGNIHVIRKSFQSLRQLCASPPDTPNWLGMLEKTMWLQHLSGLLAASVTVCHAVEKKGRPVLVHCSDGWDRTPQIVATAQLCLDPYYRTVEGFRILVEREWLSYGHKFADRCGHGPGADELNERCPVFLQWLDLVHQIHKQFSCSFEFSMGYLIKLAQHSLSCLFGTFFCNTLKERFENSVFERTFSVWPFLSGPMYRNPLYVANRDKVLWPAHNVRDLFLWTEVYLGSLGDKNSSDFPPCNSDGLQGSISPMAKTRSYGDLITAGIIQNGISRRSSDPNMTVDPNLTIGSNSENNSVTDNQSDREDSPDFIANLIHDTTRQLQNLTIELNNHDDDNYKPLQSKHKSYEFHEYSFENSSVEAVDCDKIASANSSSTMQKLFQHQQHQQKVNSTELGEQSERTSNELASFISSPPLTIHKIGCEINSTSSKLTTLACAISSTPSAVCSSVLPSTLTADETYNSFNGFLNTLTDISEPNNPEKYLKTDNNSKEEIISIHAAKGMNLDLMQSVDLSDADAINTTNQVFGEALANYDVHNNTEDNHDTWHGSVNTSTDTLVPLDCRRTTAQNGDKTADDHDDIDGLYFPNDKSRSNTKASVSLMETVKYDTKATIGGYSTTQQHQQCYILPKVHSRSNIATLIDNTSTPAPALSSLSESNGLNYDKSNKKHNTENCSQSNQNIADTSYGDINDDNDAVTLNPMEESILILPEHQKLEISINGDCETIINNIAFATSTTTTSENNKMIINSAKPVASTIATPSTATQRRRRTSSSNSRRDGFYAAKPVNGSTTSKFSLPGIRSLPLTPPNLPERTQIAISCPDGLAHALSEQNIRLQQIVHEHKLREDVLLREIHDMRMALLKKTCPNCNHNTATNDEQVDEYLNEIEHRMFNCCSFCCCALCAVCKKITKRRRHQRRYSRVINANDDDDEGLVFYGSSSASACSALDNVENASICSWEAVEDRSGPSSCTSSSVQPNASSVLWVPDHAVSRCTSCQTEFWLGRRKHHCRSCGQIFCADCSEFWAPLPDEKLFNPVRLCGPCYHSVTTRMQLQQQQLQRYKRNTASNIANNSSMGNVAVAANALTLKTLSALALAQKTKAILSKAAAAAPRSKELNVRPTTKTTGLSGSNNSNASTLATAKAIGVVNCCNHSATVASLCQQQQAATAALN